MFITKTSIQVCWILIITLAGQCKGGDKPPEILRDPSFLQLLNKHYSSIQPKRLHPGRTNGRYRNPEESPQQFPSSADNTHPTNHDGYQYEAKSQQSQQTTGSATGGEQTDWKQSPSMYPSSSKEYWSSQPNISYSYSEGYTSHAYNPSYNQAQLRPTGSSAMYHKGHYVNDGMQQGSYATTYTQARPVIYRQKPTVKKPPTHSTKHKLIKITEGSKVKYKKIAPTSYAANTATANKKMIYPRIHTPHTGTKYPTKKTVHPYYRKYYQQYQQYQYPPYQYYSSPNDVTRGKIKKYPGYSSDYYSYYNSGTTPTPEIKVQSTTTTERMDGNYQERIPIEDYSNYNDTYKNNNTSSYYETYEAPDEPNAALDTGYGYGYESSTRGYYGDRVYMSTQTTATGDHGTEVPLNTPFRYIIP